MKNKTKNHNTIAMIDSNAIYHRFLNDKRDMSGWNDVEFELHLPFAPSIGDSLYMDSGDTDLQKDFGTEEFVVINRYYLLKENEEGIREGTLVIHIIPK